MGNGFDCCGDNTIIPISVEDVCKSPICEDTTVVEIIGYPEQSSLDYNSSVYISWTIVNTRYQPLINQILYSFNDETYSYILDCTNHNDPYWGQINISEAGILYVKVRCNLNGTFYESIPISVPVVETTNLPNYIIEAKRCGSISYTTQIWVNSNGVPKINVLPTGYKTVYFQYEGECFYIDTDSINLKKPYDPSIIYTNTVVLDSVDLEFEDCQSCLDSESINIFTGDYVEGIGCGYNKTYSIENIGCIFFEYDTVDGVDRFVVTDTQTGRILLDTGCVITDGWRHINVNTSDVLFITVSVIAQCLNPEIDNWRFRVSQCSEGWVFSSSSSSSQGCGGGLGTIDNPFLICDIESLQAISYQDTGFGGYNFGTDSLSSYYQITNNIDASSTEFWNETTPGVYSGFVPIGNLITQFTGRFDGQKFIINNLHINRPTESSVGLFGRITAGAVVENTIVTNATINGSYETSVLVGASGLQSVITECYVTGSMTVTGSADTKSGGIAGTVGNSTVLKCFSDVSISGNKNQMGCLCGYVKARDGEADNALIENCYSTGDVTGNGLKTGGMIGDTDGGKVTVRNCYSISKVTGLNKKGLIGYRYTTYGTSIVTSSYWDTYTSTCPTSVGGTGVGFSAMQDIGTFVGWDFDTVWSINDSYNNRRPYLKWAESLVDYSPPLPI